MRPMPWSILGDRPFKVLMRESQGLFPVGKSEVRRVDNLVREKGGDKIDAVDF